MKEPYVDPNLYVDESQYEEIKRKDFIAALTIGSRCAWGFTGGMALLMFLKENLYLENQMFPYAAKICFIAGLLIATLIDACYMNIIKERAK